MKKIVLGSFLAFVFIFNIGTAIANVNPLKQLTGDVWMASSNDNKKALIYGVECAVSIEYAMAEHFAKKHGKPIDKESLVATLSLFPKNWITVFENTTRDTIVNKINTWYANNKDKLSTPVFEVIWKHIMQPKLK